MKKALLALAIPTLQEPPQLDPYSLSCGILKKAVCAALGKNIVRQVRPCVRLDKTVSLGTIPTNPTSQQAQNSSNIPSILAVDMHATYGNSPCLYRDVRYRFYSPI